MPYFITIQYPYQYVTVTLSNNKTIIAEETITKFQATALLIPALQKILEKHNIELTSIDCIGVNAGPGPFNTLRSIIATANAISFAKKIPLITCNGLDLLLESTPTNAVAILDAFSNDVYFKMKQSGIEHYSSIERLIANLNELYPNETIHFVGNGALKHQSFIMQNFIGIAEINESILFGSTQALIKQVCKKYDEKDFITQIFPLYFASPVIK